MTPLWPALYLLHLRPEPSETTAPSSLRDRQGRSDELGASNAQEVNERTGGKRVYNARRFALTCVRCYKS